MDISRDVKEGVGPDGIDVRLYNFGGVNHPSVTSILKTRDEDMSGLNGWKEDNDGEGDNAFHEHLFWYSRHRGTLCHWNALNRIADVPYTEDEASSMWAIKNIDKLNDDTVHHPSNEIMGNTFTVDGENHTEVWDATPRDVLYSVWKNKHVAESWGQFYDSYPPHRPHDFYSVGLSKTLNRDINYFVEAFDRMCEKMGVTEESVIAAEQYLFDDEYEYAGQVDLVYESPNGDTVVADLKTSSGCYIKHRLQGAAYAKAIERTDGFPNEVDRLEVWRMQPDKGEYVVHSGDETVPMHSDKYWEEEYDELWDEFASLAQNFDYDE